MDKYTSLKIIFLFLTVFLVSCTNNSSISNNKYCLTDSECVPSSCCHPTDAINIDSAPDCAGAICTLSCEPGTLDCGQGEVKCVNNQCMAIIN
ncbi:MAG TPA: hypothetical protein VJC39_04800 [Candidatus Nanoarchaeia archaeon]|nr:hypothetical protein [Candidatus Nanoarchaeia archaeon]